MEAKSYQKMFGIEEAMAAAETTLAMLKDACERIELAGSLRRKKPRVHDIDLVAIPRHAERLRHSLFPESEFFSLLDESLIAFESAGKTLIRTNGSKLKRLLVGPQSIQVDLYIATPENWATLMLIRTGSKEHNIYLCGLARSMGMELKADGSGLFRDGRMIAGDSEESIFRALGLSFVRPENRERIDRRLI